jgi:hypothetical protein
MMETGGKMSSPMTFGERSPSRCSLAVLIVPQVDALLDDRRLSGQVRFVRHTGRSSSGRLRSFGDGEGVAVRVAEGEQGGHARPAENVIGVNADGGKGCVCGFGVVGGKSDADGSAGDVRCSGFQGDRGVVLAGVEFDPAAAVGSRVVPDNGEAAGVDEELEGSVLVVDGDADGATPVMCVEVIGCSSSVWLGCVRRDDGDAVTGLLAYLGAQVGRRREPASASPRAMNETWNRWPRPGRGRGPGLG